MVEGRGCWGGWLGDIVECRRSGDWWTSLEFADVSAESAEGGTAPLTAAKRAPWRMAAWDVNANVRRWDGESVD